MHAVIYHNPQCATSRNALALIRHAGIEPQVIDCLRHPPSRERLTELIAAAGLNVREAIRQNGTPYLELGLDDPQLSDEALLDAMVRTPVLINRPFVQTAMGVRLCRPSERVLDILPPVSAPFAKEDGEVVIDENGRRNRSPAS
jgi:arsenate reductase